MVHLPGLGGFVGEAKAGYMGFLSGLLKVVGGGFSTAVPAALRAGTSCSYAGPARPLGKVRSTLAVTFG